MKTHKKTKITMERQKNGKWEMRKVTIFSVIQQYFMFYVNFMVTFEIVFYRRKEK